MLIILTLVLLGLSVNPARAVYFGTGENISLDKGQKINETVFVASNDLQVDADINGDLFCAGQNVVVNGKISGDVICVGQSVKINGAIAGNVRLAGQQIEINSAVNGNVSVLAQNFLLTNDASTKGDLLFGGQNATIQGNVGRDVAGAAETWSQTGSLSRNAKVTASKITVADPAKIGGNFDYYTEKTGKISINEKSVKGKIYRHEIQVKERVKTEKIAEQITIWGKFIQIIYLTISSYLVVLILLYFTPTKVNSITHTIKYHSVKSALIGLAVLVSGPVAILISFLTVVGITTGALIGLFYAISLILAFSYVVIAISQLIGSRLRQLHHSIYLSTLVGCLVLSVIVSLPFLGMLIGFIVLLVGLGAAFYSYLPES